MRLGVALVSRKGFRFLAQADWSSFAPLLTWVIKTREWRNPKHQEASSLICIATNVEASLFPIAILVRPAKQQQNWFDQESRRVVLLTTPEEVEVKRDPVTVSVPPRWNY